MLNHLNAIKKLWKNLHNTLDKSNVKMNNENIYAVLLRKIRTFYDGKKKMQNLIFIKQSNAYVLSIVLDKAN